MLRRLAGAVTTSALVAFAALAVGVPAADAKTGCPKQGSSAGSGNQYPPGQCKAKSDKKKVEQGGQVTVEGDGFSKNESVEGELHSTIVKLFTLPATTTGTIKRTVTIPKNTPVGQHFISLYGVGSNTYLTVDIEVVPAALPHVDTPGAGGTGTGGAGTGGTVGGLPFTGAQLGGLTVGGVGALGLGAALVVAGRRRRAPIAA